MKTVFRILIAIIVVCALVVGRRGPRVLASSIVAAGDTDREALVALYRATDDANWLNRANWLDDAPIDTWHGVTTDDSGRVIGLDLSENGLRGTIPSELGNLTNLEGLALSDNELSGTIPPELGNLTNLELLYLWGNELSGTIPSELGNLTNLELLDLSENGLGGTIPSELGNLTNLELLALWGNQLSGTIPSELGKLTNLTMLALSGNELSGTIPSQLGNLTNLEGLDLWNNQLSGTIPSELGKLTNLIEMGLDSNQLSGSIPSELGKLTSLEKLYLSGNQLSGCVPEVWRNVEENDLDKVILPLCTDRDVLVALYQATDGANWLNRANWLDDAPIDTWHGVTTDDSGRVIGLDLSENGLRGTIPSELGTLTNLQWLALSENELSGTIPSELGNLTNLQGLALSENQFRGTIPSELGNLTNLQWLALSDNELSGTIPSELGKLANLTVLALSENQLSGTIPSELGNLTNLEGLYLWDNQLGGTIPSELGNLTQLEALDLEINRLTGRIPLELGKLTNLDWLYLSGNRLSGCVPEVWRNAEENDLDKVILPLCTDRDVLVALYQATDGANWLNRANWLDDAPIDTWHGVTTDDSGRVIGLDLSENGLRGTIPSELGTLTNLQWLALSENELSGTIPSELGNLTNLQGLALSENQFRGTIPSELGNLTNLQWLALSDNELSGTIPSELGKLANLTVLALSENQLSGTIPSELGNLTNLEGLYLWDNQLGGTIPSELGNLTQLEALDLEINRLTGRIPLELGKLTNLDWLYLLGNRLSGCVPEVWRNAEENDLDKVILPFCTDRDVLVALYRAANGTNWLRSDNWLNDAPIDTWHGVTTDDSGRVIGLDLSENRLRGTIPSELGNLTNLQELYLYSNQLSGTIPPELGKLTNLTRLSLTSTELSGTIPPELGNLTNLELLYLGGNELSGTIPSELGNLTNLTGLALWGNQLSGTIPSEFGNLTNLEGLSLSANQLSGSIPSALGKLTSLEELYLWGNKLSGTIPSELRKLTNLTVLALSGNELSGTIPSELGKLTNLIEMGLDSNQLSGSIPSELGNLTRLQTLRLWDNELSGTIPSELGNLTSLTLLYLSGNRLNGCVPQVWRNVEENDFESLGLRFCVAPSPTPTAVTETLTPAQIFRKVSPAIAFIQTATSTGSGVLVEGGYLVTNAHVVWPFDAARVVFPDGTAFNGVPVKGWDLLADLAVLGPIDAPAQPVTLLDGENVPIGSDMYLIGYPGEFEPFPQPTIVRGILSRLREWELVGITYFQTDTTIVGGQSGGALVSETGDVIGISGFRILEGKFGFVASAADLLPRIRQLIAGEDPAGLGERRLPRSEGGTLSVTSRLYWNAYIINEPAGAAIEIELSGATDARIRVFDSFGGELADAETDSLSFVTEIDGPHFLIVSQDSEEFTLSANHRLIRFDDPDRDRQIRVGQSLRGNIDFPGDIDSFLLHLEENETVEIVARSALADTRLAIWGEAAEEWVIDDDSGGGLFGLDARIVYRVPQTGEYVLIVEDAGRSAPGGYVISVDRAQATDRPTAQVPTVTINTHINVREGPGVNYPIISAAAPGEAYVITGKNPGLGDWWEIDYKGRTGWVYGPLVTATNAQSVQAVATPDPP